MEMRNIIPNTLTYTSLLLSYNRIGNRSKMISLFKDMEARGIACDAIAYSVMASAYCKEGNSLEALKLLNKSLVEGIKLDNDVIDALLFHLCQEEKLSTILELLDERGKEELYLSSTTCNALLLGFYNAGNEDEASKVLGIMQRLGWVPASLSLTDSISAGRNNIKSDNFPSIAMQVGSV